jgi:hypothetical protein
MKHIIGLAYNFGMTLREFLRLLVNTPRDKHPELILWFAAQHKASTDRSKLKY